MRGTLARAHLQDSSAGAHVSWYQYDSGRMMRTIEPRVSAMSTTCRSTPHARRSAYELSSLPSPAIPPRYAVVQASASSFVPEQPTCGKQPGGQTQTPRSTPQGEPATWNASRTCEASESENRCGRTLYEDRSGRRGRWARCLVPHRQKRISTRLIDPFGKELIYTFPHARSWARNLTISK